MRLLNMVLTAAIVMFGLVGVAAFDGTAAGAQEEPTRQTFETREITGSGATPERATRTPTSEQSTRDAKANTGCPGARVIGTVGPTDKDLIIGPFNVTGEKFRLTYETTDADNSGVPFFDVTVLDEQRNEVGGRVIFDEGIVREFVVASPGTFTIEARAEDLKYAITGEDCTGTGSGGDGRQPVPINPVPEDQYRSDVDPPDEDIIDNTVSDEPLPNTGGVPLLGPTVFAFICVSAGFVLLRPVIRRNS
ncbi:MAG: hypothetical protein H0U55_04320 [Rubrobacteraceae bacterium]|nr:hypothetical protein [Rubrobacteraceae bacterium]